MTVARQKTAVNDYENAMSGNVVGATSPRWVLVPLGKLFEFKNGVNADRSAYGSGVPFANVLEVIENTHLYGSGIRGRVSLPEKLVKTYRLLPGDLLFNRTSETQEEVGLASVFLDDALAVFGGFVIRARPKGAHFDAAYTGYGFRSPFLRKQIVAIGQGAIHANIGQADLRKLITPVPELNEQRAIAAALLDADAMVGSLDKLIAKKRAIKVAAMQQLLTGKIRVVGYGEDWMRAKLGDLAEIVDPHPSHRAPAEHSDGIPFVGIGDISCDGTIDRSSARLVHFSVFEEHSKRYDLSDSLVGLGRVASIGKVVRLRQDEAPFTVSPTMAVVRSVGPNPIFLYYALSSRGAATQFDRISNGSTRQSVGMNVLRNILIELPCSVQEQDAIALILSDMDAEIGALECRREKVAAVKRGMMQALLTGRVRLVTPEPESMPEPVS